MGPEKSYSPAEVAAVLGLQVQAIYRRIKRGSLGAVKLSATRLRIPESELVRVSREGFGPRRVAGNGDGVQ